MKKFRDPNEVKEELRSRTDLVDFISRYIDLKQKGKRWVGFCPFHDDKKKPGFTVSPEAVWQQTGAKGVWACWSCDAKGDLFAFVQKAHNIEFMDAITIVAEIIEFDLTPYYRNLTVEEQLQEDRYNVVAEVAELFHETLMKLPKRLAFFLDRGIERKTLEQFKIGYCPSLSFLASNLSLEVQTLIEPDFSRRSQLFGGRFLYPQFTTGGRIWGWYGRQRPGMTDGPKYASTSTEAPLYDTHGRVYGLFQARQLMRLTQTPLVVEEGFHDTLMTQQAGFPAVATCGTQLSADQIETLHSHAIRRMTICFDDDAAGQGAMLKLATTAHKYDGLDFQFVDIAGEPEEFIRENGADAFGELLQEARSPIDYIIHRHADFDTSTPTRKRDFLEHIRPFLAPYPRNSLNRALGVQAVSRITGLSEAVISDYLEEHSEGPLMNLTGEIIVLAELAQNPAAWITSSITEEHFSLNRYRQTFRLMAEIYEREAEVNIELLAMQAMNINAPTEVRETISKLPSVHRKNPDTFAADIKDKAERRQALEWGNKLRLGVSDLRTPFNETISYFIEGLTTAITSHTTKTLFSSAEAITLTLEEIERRANLETGIAGLNLGPNWKWMTEALNGLRPKRLTCIAAFSGVGKSLALINWVHALSISGESAGLIASLEMTAEENNLRLAAIDSGLPHSQIDHARLSSQKDADKLYRSMDRIKNARIHWMTESPSMKEIAMQARILQAKGELDYIAIDYVQLLDTSSYPHHWNPHDIFSSISQEIKVLADNLNVPIIELAQLNRKSAEEDIPNLEHMGSSIKIAQDAHAVFILVKREHGLLGALVKNRGGGSGAIDLSFDRNMQTSSLLVKEIKARPHR